MAQTVYILIDSTLPTVSLVIARTLSESNYSYIGKGQSVSFIPSPSSLDLGQADAAMAFNIDGYGRSAQFSFAEIGIFTIDGADQIDPLTPIATDLQDVINLCAPYFFVDAGQGGGTLSGNGLFYVSASAPVGGNGSIERPFQTITAGNAAAAVFFAANGFAATVYVIAGQYDEAITLAAHLVFMDGATVIYTDTAATAAIIIDGSGGDELTITGSDIYAQGAGIYALSAVGSCRFVECKFLAVDSAVLLDGANAIFTNCRIAAALALAKAVIYGPSALSYASFTGCTILSASSVAIDVQGAGLKLYQCRIVGTGNSVTASAGAQTIETFGSVANVAVGAGVTQVVGTITVNANVTAD